MTMLETVARAICRTTMRLPSDAEMGNWWRMYIPEANAALTIALEEAAKEVERLRMDVVMASGDDDYGPVLELAAKRIRSLDAALSETEESGTS